MLLPALLTLSLALGADPADDGPRGGAWRHVDDVDGLGIDVKEVDGSAVEAVRITGTSPVSAATLATVWWGKAGDTGDTPSVKRREVLEDKGNDRVYYDVVAVPFGDDRDYVLRARRSDNADGSIALRFDSVDDARRPPAAGRIRMSVSSRVFVTPLPNGNCRFVYLVWSDIKGSVPSFAVNSAQRGELRGQLRQLLERAARSKR